MNASILSQGDRRHLVSPPAKPPEGRHYLSPHDTICQGDVFWDGTEEAWSQGSRDYEGLEARHFVCVCRRGPGAPSLKHCHNPERIPRPNKYKKKPSLHRAPATGYRCHG